MKFRYYLVSLHSGDVTGTNNLKYARSLAGSEDDFVIDSETGMWLLEEDGSQDIPIPQAIEPEDM